MKITKYLNNHQWKLAVIFLATVSLVWNNPFSDPMNLWIAYMIAHVIDKLERKEETQ